MSDRNHITVAQTQKPQGREYLVDCKHCCVSCYPSRSRRAWCFPSLHLAQRVKEMLAEHCERSSRYRGPYHLHKDGKNLFGEGQRKPRHLKVSVCLTLSSMELCPVGPSQLCLCWSQWLKKKINLELLVNQEFLEVWHLSKCGCLLLQAKQVPPRQRGLQGQEETRGAKSIWQSFKEQLQWYFQKTTQQRGKEGVKVGRCPPLFRQEFTYVLEFVSFFAAVKLRKELKGKSGK